MSDTQPLPGSPDEGSVLAGRYRLEGRVGRGGMADVFRARDEQLHRTVAVKLFRFDPAEETARARIEAEMRTVAGLRNPGLVTLHDAHIAGDDENFLVMEFVEGPSLREHLANGPLPAGEVARLGAELATSLAYVHANGIVHRDVKPANVLLDGHPDGSALPTAKLTDFGIARLTDSARLTVEGMTVGTANYLSPEQARGEPVAPASDIYSLGLVLLECLTGYLEYPGALVEAAVARLQRSPHIPPQFEPQWGALLTAMTTPDPDQRPDATQVAHALTSLRAAATAADVTEVLPASADRDATAVLGVAQAPGSTAVFGVAQAPGSTAVLGAANTPGSTPFRPTAPRRRQRLGFLVAALLAVAALVTVLIVASSSSGGDSGTDLGPPPTYPSVPGQLGRDLEILEGAVS